MLRRTSYSVSGSRSKMLPAKRSGTVYSRFSVARNTRSPPMRNSGSACLQSVAPAFRNCTSTVAFRLSSPEISHSNPRQINVGGSTTNAPASTPFSARIGNAASSSRNGTIARGTCCIGNSSNDILPLARRERAGVRSHYATLQAARAVAAAGRTALRGRHAEDRNHPVAGWEASLPLPDVRRRVDQPFSYRYSAARRARLPRYLLHHHQQHRRVQVSVDICRTSHHGHSAGERKGSDLEGQLARAIQYAQLSRDHPASPRGARVQRAGSEPLHPPGELCRARQ